MFMKDELYFNIEYYLSQIKALVELQNNRGAFDINKYCEDFFCGFLNITYNLKLSSLNTFNMSFPAVDLGDIENSICIQVTSQSGLDKIRHTIDMFEKNNMFENYANLIIFILGNKKGYTGKVETNGLYNFTLKYNVIDLNDLAINIHNLDIDKIKAILNYIKVHGININNPNIERDKRLLTDFINSVNGCIQELIDHDFSVNITTEKFKNDLMDIVREWRLWDKSFIINELEVCKQEIIGGIESICNYLMPPYMGVNNQYGNMLPYKDPKREVFNDMKDNTIELRKCVVNAYQRLCETGKML